MGIIKKILSVFRWVWKLPIIVKLILLIALGAAGWFLYPTFSPSKTAKSTYQTTTVGRGTIVAGVTATGQVSSANSASVTTEASGVITKLYVKDGDDVKTGDKIADIELDLEGKQRAAQAYSSYQSAKNSLQSAQDKYYSLQSTMMTQWKTYMDTAQNSTYQNSDESPNTANRNLPQFYSIMDDWLASEADYKNQEGIVSQAQTALNNAWLSYQQTSPVIYAPISGTVTGLSLQIGSVITAQSNSSGGASAQTIANIKTDAMPTITVNLTEVDTPKITIGDKATLTFDAIPDKTYTGEVVSINTVGSVSSGVTTYPAVVKLDIRTEEILPNMAAQVVIIIATKNDVLTVPITSIQTENGASYVRLLRNGQMEQNAVEVGLSSDTDAEIISGLSEGDMVITSMTNGTTAGKSNNQSTSIFGGGGFRMGR